MLQTRERKNPTGTARSQPSRRKLTGFWVLTVLVLALHNAEELFFGLTDWAAAHPWMLGGALHGDQAQFAVAVAIVSVAVLALAIVAVITRAEWSSATLVGVAYALIINAGSHLVLSAASWSLMPGTVTGAVLLLPFGLLVLRELPRVEWTRRSVVMTAVAAVALVVGSLGIAAALSAVLEFLP